jgi:hypothetical protein
MVVGMVAGLLAGGVLADPATPEQIDEMWARRDEPGVAQQLEPAIRQALKANPGDFDLLWRAARERAWTADNAPDPRLKKQAGKEAWNYAEEAKKVAPERAEGYYYAGIGVGAHAVGVGVFKAISLGLERQFLENMEKAAKLDPRLDRGGPLLALGRYYYTVPWPKQDLNKATHFYEQVLTWFPENLRARHYLAQLKLRQNDKEGARLLIAQVREANVDYDPAEGRRVQAWSARTEQQIH